MSETSERRDAMPVMHALSLLRPQTVVAVLAFIALSSVGELRQVYRDMVLDLPHGSKGFVVAILSIILLSLLIWFSSILVLRPISWSAWSDWRRASEHGYWRHLLRPLSSRSRDAADIPPAIALLVAGISVLPLLGCALGLWLAIPGTPARDAVPFPVQEQRVPDQPGPQKRTELPFVFAASVEV